MRQTSMLAFQLIGLALLTLFFGSLVTGDPRKRER
jgi:hypothetical protein